MYYSVECYNREWYYRDCRYYMYLYYPYGERSYYRDGWFYSVVRYIRECIYSDCSVYSDGSDYMVGVIFYSFYGIEVSHGDCPLVASDAVGNRWVIVPTIAIGDSDYVSQCRLLSLYIH